MFWWVHLGGTGRGSGALYRHSVAIQTFKPAPFIRWNVIKSAESTQLSFCETTQTLGGNTRQRTLIADRKLAGKSAENVKLLSSSIPDVRKRLFIVHEPTPAIQTRTPRRCGLTGPVSSSSRAGNSRGSGKGEPIGFKPYPSGPAFGSALFLCK